MTKYNYNIEKRQRGGELTVTIIDISRKDTSHRALLSEQYMDMAAIFKYIANMFATEHKAEEHIRLLDITVKEKDTEEERDLGYTTVKTLQTGRTLSLDFHSLLANELLPSVVLDDEMVFNLEFAGISFEHEDCDSPIEVLIDFEQREDDEVVRTAVIVVRMSEEDVEVPIEDMYFAIGYLQYIVSAAEAARAIEEYEKSKQET